MFSEMKDKESRSWKFSKMFLNVTLYSKFHFIKIWETSMFFRLNLTEIFKTFKVFKIITYTTVLIFEK